MTKNDQLINAIIDGKLDLAQKLLKDPDIYSFYKYRYSFTIASKYGRLKIVKELLKNENVDPSTDYNFAIRSAAEHGHLEIVKLLLKDPRVDPTTDANYAIRYAAKNNHLDIVLELLKDKRVLDMIIKYYEYVSGTSLQDALIRLLELDEENELVQVLKII